MERIIGIGLAAGQGVRFRPLTLKAKGYLRAKAAVRLLGRRVLDWLVHILEREGIEDFVMVTKGKENRYQIKSIVGYGELLGVRVRYSPVSYDRDNTGSGDALLTNLEHFDIQDTAFVFPTDSVLDINLAAMLAQHRRTGAVVTIAAARQTAEVIANRYGLMDSDGDGRVRGFVEKPSLREIHELFGSPDDPTQSLPPLMTNAGFYLIDSRVLRELAHRPDLDTQRRKKLDIGGDLLPWLVRHDYPVYLHEIGRMGDLGNISSYLETMVDALHGRFQSMMELMSRYYAAGEASWIDPESLAMTDPVSHLTLAEKLERGLVEIRPPVRIGKYARIYPGVVLQECNIDDDCEINEHATIIRSSIGAGSIIGPFSYIEDTLTGLMVELHSSEPEPVSLTNFVAIGDEVVVRGGVDISHGVTIHPRLKVPTGVRIPPQREIENAEQMLEHM